MFPLRNTENQEYFQCEQFFCMPTVHRNSQLKMSSQYKEEYYTNYFICRFERLRKNNLFLWARNMIDCAQFIELSFVTLYDYVTAHKEKCV